MLSYEIHHHLHHASEYEGGEESDKRTRFLAAVVK